MSIEKIILSREGSSEIKKLCNFISHLVIKNEAEGKLVETKEAFSNYFRYESAYQSSMDVYSLKYAEEDLILYFTRNEIDKYKLQEPENLSKVLNSTSTAPVASNLRNKAKNMLTSMQEDIIKSYNELNPYYRTFLGLPPTNKDILYVENLDQETSPTEGGTFPLHEIDYNKYPLTYEALFVNRQIDEIINTEERYNLERDNPKDLTYIRFLESGKRKSPFFIRRSPNYTLMYYKNGILNEDEYRKFEVSYNKARKYVTEIQYYVGMSDRYPMYSIVMLQMLLAATVMYYYNSFLYDYSVKNYTRNDIFDILESEGLGNLKSIKDLSILRKIVENLDLLNKYKGSEKALTILFDIINDKTLTVKNYVIKKNYAVDVDGNLKYKEKEFYDKSVNISLEENIIIRGENTADRSERTIDYDEFVKNDNTWGGIRKNTSNEIKEKMKADLKNSIIQMNFDKLDTKYISLSKTFNIYEKGNEINSVMYMIFKICYEEENQEDNFLEESEVLFKDNITVTPIQLWAAQCYLSSIISGISDPEIIRPDYSCFSSVFALRNKNGLLSFINEFSNKNIAEEIEIMDPNLNRPIKEVLDTDTISKFLIKYNMNEESSIVDIIEQLGDNIDIMYALSDEIIKVSEKDIFDSYFKIWDVNEISYNYNHVYQGYETFTEYLERFNNPLLTYIHQVVEESELPHNNRLDILFEAHSEILNLFRKCLDEYLEGSYHLSDESKGNDLAYLNDLKVLFSEYLSIYLQLYEMEQVFDISNIPRNLLRVFFSSGERRVYDKLYDKIGVAFKSRLKQIMLKKEDFITTDHGIKFEIDWSDGGEIAKEFQIFLEFKIKELLRELQFKVNLKLEHAIKRNKSVSLIKQKEENDFFSFKNILTDLYAEIFREEKLKLDVKLNNLTACKTYRQFIGRVFVPNKRKVIIKIKNPEVQLEHKLKITPIKEKSNAN